jgi:diaminohydroxyphosphoribosylaminopyrimidine deaminase/5-amino-6-(5-phosphoribosylamino)uracil reductase
MEADAVLVGAGTVRADDPALTIRGRTLPEGKAQPWRVVLTRTGALPAASQIFTDVHRERTLVYTNRPLGEVLTDLGSSRSVVSVLAEGGGVLLGELFAEGLVDEVCFYLAPLICGGSKGAVEIPAGALMGAVQLEETRYKRLGNDLRLTGLVARSQAL